VETSLWKRIWTCITADYLGRCKTKLSVASCVLFSTSRDYLFVYTYMRKYTYEVWPLKKGVAVENALLIIVIMCYPFRSIFRRQSCTAPYQLSRLRSISWNNFVRVVFLAFLCTNDNLFSQNSSLVPFFFKFSSLMERHVILCYPQNLFALKTSWDIQTQELLTRCLLHTTHVTNWRFRWQFFYFQRNLLLTRC